MRNMGATEAANAIRGQFFSDRSMRGDPEDAHRMKYAKDVCAQLGAEPTPENVQHVMLLLREHDIELHAGHEYPKYAVRSYDRAQKIVHSEGEAHSWENEEPPEPTDEQPPGRIIEAPVQDLSIDLVDKVPHMAPKTDHPEGRVPSAVTNRDAAQDAYARQPVEGRDRELAADAYVENTDPVDHSHEHVDDDGHDDDGEVHIETLAPDGTKAEGGAPYAKPASEGLMKHDDPDGDGFAGQDVNPTHDSKLGTQEPQHRSGDSSAGKTDTNRRPVGNRTPNKRP